MYRNMVRAGVLVSVAAGIFFSLLLLLWWQAPAVVPTPAYQLVDASALSLSATSWLIFDLESGEILAAHNESAPVSLASITKLPVAAQLLQRRDSDARAVAAAADIATEGQAGDLQLGREYTYRELALVTLLTSSNDASAVLARVEPELLTELNDYVAGLGLQATVFTDTSGLSAGNRSTAAEVATLVRALYFEVPAVFDMTRLAVFYTPDGAHGWFNNNPFHTDPSYRGGKNGFTYEAGRTVVALFSEPVGTSERTLGYILLGSDDLTADMMMLREFVATSVTYE